MVMLLLFSLLSIGASILVFKKVSNKFLRYSLMFIFLIIAISMFWILWIAAKSGEM